MAPQPVLDLIRLTGPRGLRPEPASNRAIVGVELEITRIEAKAKLSQNRPAADVEGVIMGLRERGDKESADAVERARA